jgi:hypothetical protein
MSNLDSMDKTIAKSEIYDLSCKYMRGLDRLDLELLKSVFHEGAWCDYGFTKSDAPTFATFCMDALKDHVANHHMIGNSLIEFDDDENTAYGEIYFNAYHKTIENGVNTDVIIAGRYLDRYERRDGVWKIVYRSEVNDWSRTEPTNDSYFDDSDCHRGGRQDDRVYSRDDRIKPS